MFQASYGINFYKLKKLSFSDRECTFLSLINKFVCMNQERKQNFHRNRYWVYLTIETLTRQESIGSKGTIIRLVKRLKELNILEVCKFNAQRFNQVNFYTINYDVLGGFLEQAKAEIKEVREDMKLERKKKMSAAMKRYLERKEQIEAYDRQVKEQVERTLAKKAMKEAEIGKRRIALLSLISDFQMNYPQYQLGHTAALAAINPWKDYYTVFRYGDDYTLGVELKRKAVRKEKNKERKVVKLLFNEEEIVNFIEEEKKRIETKVQQMRKFIDSKYLRYLYSCKTDAEYRFLVQKIYMLERLRAMKQLA